MAAQAQARLVLFQGSEEIKRNQGGLDLVENQYASFLQAKKRVHQLNCTALHRGLLVFPSLSWWTFQRIWSVSRDCCSGDIPVGNRHATGALGGHRASGPSGF